MEELYGVYREGGREAGEEADGEGVLEVLNRGVFNFYAKSLHDFLTPQKHIDTNVCSGIKWICKSEQIC